MTKTNQSQHIHIQIHFLVEVREEFSHDLCKTCANTVGSEFGLMKCQTWENFNKTKERISASITRQHKPGNIPRRYLELSKGGLKTKNVSIGSNLIL